MVLKAAELVDLARGQVDRRVFSSEELYARELDQIFGRAWLMIGHESQVPSPNDFFLTYMGEDPVILCRAASGTLRAFLNMCRHRGNRIVRADDGNAKNFMCAYHGWTYSNEGKLVSVPGLQEAYYGELDVDALGLVEVAHLDSYKGMVFATWAEDAPSLRDYLGDMAWLLDITFDRLEGGTEFVGPDKWMGRFNWKISTDNFTGDQYHAPLSHRSAFVARRGERNPVLDDYFTYTRPGYEISPGNGHGMGVHWLEEGAMERMLSIAGPAAAWEVSVLDQVEQRLGTVRAKRLFMGNASVFPNMSFLANGTVRVWQPRGPFQTEIWSWTAIEKAAPEEIKRLKRIGCMATFGPSGMLEQDDMDNWRQSTEAGTSMVARRYPSHIVMGLGHETTHPELPGTVIPNLYAEVNQRSLYGRWAEMMDARGWSDISIAPRTKV